jgi:hypothetical protein
MVSLPQLDLVECPFTDAGSRMVVQRSESALLVSAARYERSLEDCRLAKLTVLTASGGPCGVVTADPVRVRLAGGATVVLAGEDSLSLALPAGRWRVELADLAMAWTVESEATGVGVTGVEHRNEGTVLVDVAGPARLLLATGEPAYAPPHSLLEGAADETWRAWFARMPVVRADLAAMTSLAWWVLRANQVRVAHDPSRMMVAPSKIGYVGAWQWDSYFVATGLRHGDPDLAWDQIAMFLDHQLPSGLIPDVVSDDGVLASAADLPAGDIGTLRTHLGQAIGGVGGTDLAVPVTKPPLTAWAVTRLQTLAPEREQLAWALPRIAASQRWWTTVSDSDGDGLSEYLHPYSSGLDDSPLFDYGVPAESPDLNSYLVLQDDLLAGMADLLGDSERAARHRSRAAARLDRLLSRRYDAARGRFQAYAAGQELPTLTPFHLFPLLTGRLPSHVVDSLVATLMDPARLWGDRPVPTVAFDEPTFDPERMWRGPAWLNVNRLVIEGLATSGRRETARELADRTLDLVVRSGGLHEYWNPLTGQRARGATTCFAWSAALFVDLAVAVTNGMLAVV